MSWRCAGVSAGSQRQASHQEAHQQKGRAAVRSAETDWQHHRAMSSSDQQWCDRGEANAPGQQTMGTADYRISGA